MFLCLSFSSYALRVLGNRRRLSVSKNPTCRTHLDHGINPTCSYDWLIVSPPVVLIKRIVVVF